MKNKNELVLPTSQTFTLKELFALNPNKKEITARVKFTKIKDSGKVAELGAITGNMGRPTKLYAFTPISRIVIAKAKADKVNLVDGLEKHIVG